jgi:hypothetical protein
MIQIAPGKEVKRYFTGTSKMTNEQRVQRMTSGKLVPLSKGTTMLNIFLFI